MSNFDKQVGSLFLVSEMFGETNSARDSASTSAWCTPQPCVCLAPHRLPSADMLSGLGGGPVPWACLLRMQNSWQTKEAHLCPGLRRGKPPDRRTVLPLCSSAKPWVARICRARGGRAPRSHQQSSVWCTHLGGTGAAGGNCLPPCKGRGPCQVSGKANHGMQKHRAGSGAASLHGPGVRGALCICVHICACLSTRARVYV